MSHDRDEAIADCKYAASLGEFALEQHIESWTAPGGWEPACPEKVWRDGEYPYHLAIMEIKSKLGTDECLIG